jgi:hypothetical protein
MLDAVEPLLGGSRDDFTARYQSRGRIRTLMYRILVLAESRKIFPLESPGPVKATETEYPVRERPPRHTIHPRIPPTIPGRLCQPAVGAQPDGRPAVIRTDSERRSTVPIMVLTCC